MSETRSSRPKGGNLPARYDQMCRAIDAAYDVDEVKDIRDKAVAWEVYSRQAHNVEAERRACEIRLRAERKAGKLLKEMEKAKGRAAPGPRNTLAASRNPRLVDLGVTAKQSSQWQRLADVPEDLFGAALIDPTWKPTTSGIINLAAPKSKVTPVSADALWLCGTLNDFERGPIALKGFGGVLSKTPEEVMSTMVPTMLDEVHRLAPKVAAWLRRIGEPK